jgi:hypothetical protein
LKNPDERSFRAVILKNTTEETAEYRFPALSGRRFDANNHKNANIIKEKSSKITVTRMVVGF